MIVYRDVLGLEDDEYFSDSYPFKVVDDIAYEIEGKYVQKEDTDDENEKVINIIQGHNLIETTYDKKQYIAHIKTYMKNLSAHLDKTNKERVADFKKQAEAFVKKILSEFDQYQFFTSKNINPNIMVVPCKWASDGLSMSLFVWKDGVIEEKY